MWTVQLGLKRGQIKRVFLSGRRSRNPEIIGILRDAEEKGIVVETVPEEEFRKRFPEARQGIAGEMEPLEEKRLEDIVQDKPEWIVALDHIEDPHNLGAIGRTCYALGIESLLLPERRQSPITPAVFQASAGYFSFLHIYRAANLRYSCQFLRKQGYWIVAVIPRVAHTVEEFSGHLPCCVIFGGEHKGISRVVLKEVDESLSIPISEKVDSLNVSVAAGIALYAMKRKWEKSRGSILQNFSGGEGDGGREKK
ncbi:MAG: TrmH family RNA methyltransferase [bacterium JZ-2024 1]